MGLLHIVLCMLGLELKDIHGAFFKCTEVEPLNEPVLTNIHQLSVRSTIDSTFRVTLTGCK